MIVRAPADTVNKLGGNSQRFFIYRVLRFFLGASRKRNRRGKVVLIYRPTLLTNE